MAKDVNYPEFIGGSVTLEQAEKVRKSGLTNSEFIRQAIDFFDETRLQSYTTQKINHVEECINVLKVYEQNLKNQHYNNIKIFDENLKDGAKNEEVVYKETENTFKKSDENLKDKGNLKGETFKKSDENLKDMENPENENPFKTIENTIIRLIARKGHLTNEDYNFQAMRVNKTTKELKKHILENLEYFENEARKYR